jgi:hypothetical protein
LSIVRYSTKLENTTFRKLDLFPSSGEEGGKTPIQLGLSEIANLKQVVVWWGLGRRGLKNNSLAYFKGFGTSTFGIRYLDDCEAS